MMTLFDTNILIDHLKGKKEATLVLQNCINNKILLACSVITRIELLSGMRTGEESKI
jgi:predicted nucleic acid-binding protein